MNKWSPTKIVPSMEAVGTTEASPTKMRIPKTMTARRIRRRLERFQNLRTDVTAAAAAGTTVLCAAFGMAGDWGFKPCSAAIFAKTDFDQNCLDHGLSESIYRRRGISSFARKDKGCNQVNTCSRQAIGSWPQAFFQAGFAPSFDGA